MKIRNLAFCGVMASILGMGGAYAATDATIIASKAYVDARDNTKQDTANIVTTEWANTDANIKSSDARYPSMKTLQTAVGAGTSALDGQNADSSTGLTAGTVDASKAGMPVVKVTETDGIVTSELGTIKNAGIASDAAITTNKMGAITGYTISTATGNARNLAETDTLNQALGKLEKKANDAAASAGYSTGENVYTEGVEPEMLTQVGAIRATIATQGNYDKSWNDGLAETAEADLEDNTKNLHAAVTEEMQNGDNYVPTVKAVEMRVQQAEAAAVANVPKETTNVLASSNTNHLPTVAAVQAAKDTGTTASENGGQITVANGTNTDDNHVPTSLAVKTDMATLATAINKKLNANTAITAKNNSIVNYDANGLVTGGTLLEDASGGLKGVNAEAEGNMGCSTSNPCVLTYLGGTGANAKYRWTAMDTDQLVAQ